MKYNLEINGKTAAMAVTEHEGDHLTVASEGRAYRMTCRRIDNHRLAIVLDGLQVNAFISGREGAREVMINGVSYRVGDADRRVPATASGRQAEKMPRDVTPPMPSVVVKVLAEEGQLVARGDSLVVVSAMKMETTLTAPFDARVGRINVSAGDKVMPGNILIDLEPVS